MEPIDAIDFEKAGGLVTAITLDDATGDVLMVAYMNAESFRRTLEIGEVVYWSRSRKCLWHKGESSGNTQRVKSVQIDCDGDAVLLRVEQRGGAAPSRRVHDSIPRRSSRPRRRPSRDRPPSSALRSPAERPPARRDGGPMARLTTHILDAAQGIPAEGVAVRG